MDNHSNHDQDENEFFSSRTEQKKAALEFRALGEQLVQLNQDKLNKIPLSEEMIQAIATAKRIKSHIALKRQFQFIGKLIRKGDAEAIQSALHSFQQEDHMHPAKIQKTEQWRDRLLAEGNAALSVFINEHPDSNRQLLGQLLRAAIKEQEQLIKQSAVHTDTPKHKVESKHKRALFKELKSIIS